MTYSARELISLTNPMVKQLGTRETVLARNERIEVLIDALAYLVMKKVDLDGMKVLMKDLNEIVDNSYWPE